MRWTVGLDSIWLQLLAFGVTVLAGHASYTFVEQPLRTSARLRGFPRGRVALGGLAAALIATAGGAVLFKGHNHISISQTAQHRNDWYTSNSTPLLPGIAGCSLSQSVRPLGGGRVTAWTPQGCGSAAPTGRLFVIGNSHALAYAPMIRQFVLDSGREARLYFRSQCAFLLLSAPMSSQEGCAAFHSGAQAEFLSELKPGDILFMPSMRLDQGTDQWGDEAPTISDPANNAAAMAEANEVLARLAATGALLVFEAPKPVIPSPTYRCVDWYMAMNPICKDGLTIDKTAMLAIRAPVLQKMQALAAKNDKVRIWDPFSTLCPGSVCEAMDGSRPIFFDRHHISAHGNRMLRGHFDASFNAWFSGASG
jgi:hypothetical protein